MMRSNDRGRGLSIFKRVKLFWDRLWIRKDEFDKSLDMDIEAMWQMTEKQKSDYLKDLVRRRQIAHERDMKASAEE